MTKSSEVKVYEASYSLYHEQYKICTRESAPMVLACDYEALQTRCEAAEMDAARYRWLRDTGAVFTTRARGADGCQCECVDIGRPAIGLDDAIDSAMAIAKTGDGE